MKIWGKRVPGMGAAGAKALGVGTSLESMRISQEAKWKQEREGMQSERCQVMKERRRIHKVVKKTATKTRVPQDVSPALS